MSRAAKSLEDLFDDFSRSSARDTSANSAPAGSQQSRAPSPSSSPVASRQSRSQSGGCSSCVAAAEEMGIDPSLLQRERSAELRLASDHRRLSRDAAELSAIEADIARSAKSAALNRTMASHTASRSSQRLSDRSVSRSPSPRSRTSSSSSSRVPSRSPVEVQEEMEEFKKIASRSPSSRTRSPQLEAEIDKLRTFATTGVPPNASRSASPVRQRTPEENAELDRFTDSISNMSITLAPSGGAVPLSSRSRSPSPSSLPSLGSSSRSGSRSPRYNAYMKGDLSHPSFDAPPPAYNAYMKGDLSHPSFDAPPPSAGSRSRTRSPEEQAELDGFLVAISAPSSRSPQVEAEIDNFLGTLDKEIDVTAQDFIEYSRSKSRSASRSASRSPSPLRSSSSRSRSPLSLRDRNSLGARSTRSLSPRDMGRGTLGPDGYPIVSHAHNNITGQKGFVTEHEGLKHHYIDGMRVSHSEYAESFPF